VPNDARVRGAEFEVNGKITPDWTVGATLAYTDAEWQSYANSGFNVLAGLSSAVGDVYRGDGNKMARVPDWNGTLTSTYRGQFKSGLQYYVRGDVLYTGKAWDSDLNIVQTDAYARVNLRAGLERNNMTLEFFTTNLFDDRNWDYASATVELAGSFTDRALLVAPAQRREFGVRTSFHF
jgi:outer membrane receptor protein involved in Fe transport